MRSEKINAAVQKKNGIRTPSLVNTAGQQGQECKHLFTQYKFVTLVDDVSGKPPASSQPWRPGSDFLIQHN